MEKKEKKEKKMAWRGGGARGRARRGAYETEIPGNIAPVPRCGLCERPKELRRPSESRGGGRPPPPKGRMGCLLEA